MGPSGSVAFVMLTASLPLLVDYYEVRYRAEDKTKSFPNTPPDSNLPANETFDFIIVGAGTAGCILARRLSERYRVLLLEAGGDPPPVESITTLVSYTKYLPGIHWFYNSTEQKDSSLSTGGRIRVTAGKMMGGSGSHNNVQYERGHPLDFDFWAKKTQDDSWRYKKILKYFLRIENYMGQFSAATGQHGKGGLMDVVKSDVTFKDDLWFSAGRELGYSVKIDSNGPQRIGFSPAEYNRRKGRRVSTYTAYVKPLEMKRKTLTVRRYSTVSEIIIENFQAVGVEYYRHGVPRAAFASKEVILSAGAYISPVILMRSGIGPRDQLKREPLLELPVGHNVQDHVIVRMPFITVTDPSVFKYSPSTVTFQDFTEFITKGTGFLASYEALHEAFLASKRAAEVDGQPDWPDIQLYFGHEYHNGTDVLTCNVNLNRERSRGRILMNKTATELEDSLVPIIDYNFLSDESDYDVLFEGVKVCQQIVERTKTFQAIGAKFAEDVIGECAKEFEQGPREYWKCYIRQRATSNFHLTSSITMGSLDDPFTVVDSKLRVLGLRSLRVVDASVMPVVTNANINAAVMMIAEKAADDILLDAS